MKFPFIGFNSFNIVTRVDEAWRVIRLAGFKGVAEVGDYFLCDGFRPEDVHRFSEITANYGPYVTESSLCESTFICAIRNRESMI